MSRNADPGPMPMAVAMVEEEVFVGVVEVPMALVEVGRVAVVSKTVDVADTCREAEEGLEMSLPVGAVASHSLLDQGLYGCCSTHYLSRRIEYLLRAFSTGRHFSPWTL